MPETFAVEQRGIGKADYSREISLGQVRPGITLKYRQTLKLFGLTASAIVTPYPYVFAPIAPGVAAHLIDYETGLALPYVVSAGYFLTAVQIGCGFTQDFHMLAYLDTFFAGYVAIGSSGDAHVWSDVAPFSTLSLDPTASLPHSWDFTIVNLGGGNMEGSASIYAVLEALGTPPLPDTKVVKCKFCGHEWEVPRETTAINCPKCGELNIYCDFSKVRRLG